MLTSSETPIIATIVLVAFGILGWGFYRAKPYGKLGILAWLQSVVLMTPWLLFFGLFAAGVYINIVSILFLLIVSAGVYIYIGRQLRAAGQDAILKQRATERLASVASQERGITNNSTSPATVAQVELEVMPIPEEDLSVIKSIFGIDTFLRQKRLLTKKVPSLKVISEEMQKKYILS